MLQKKMPTYFLTRKGTTTLSESWARAKSFAPRQCQRAEFYKIVCQFYKAFAPSTEFLTSAALQGH